MHWKRWRAHGDTDKAKAGHKSGIPLSGEHRQHIGEAIRQAIAEGRKSTKRGPISESHRAALLKAITGRPSSTKGKSISPEKRAWTKADRQSPEAIRKIGEASKRHWQNPEYREQMIVERKGRWEDPDFRAKGIAYLRDIQKPTSIEVAVAEALTALGVDFEQQKVVGRFICDIFVPHLQLDVECDGLYWHSLPGMRDRDHNRDAWFGERGYRVLRLSEKAIRADAREAVLAGLARIAPP
jgi:very-short-patch-repair endonuclease